MDPDDNHPDDPNNFPDESDTDQFGHPVECAEPDCACHRSVSAYSDLLLWCPVECGCGDDFTPDLDTRCTCLCTACRNDDPHSGCTV